MHSTTENKKNILDVVIVGAGASGTALLYTLATYTNISRITIIEKYDKPGQVNSRASNNSQTLHVGDIETNYSVDKVRQVYPAAMMVAHYAQHLPESERNEFLFPTAKMVIGVGAKEVALLEQRFTDLQPIFPELQRLSREQIALREPEIVRGRAENIPLIALATNTGFAVDFEKLSLSLLNNAKKSNSAIETKFSTTVTHLEKIPEGYAVHTNTGETLYTRVLVVDADSYSLLLAQQLGYGKEFSLIPIAGSFYFSKKLLNGKVYTVQEPKLPFAAVHGDPDIHVPDETRWGPTARFHPVLEARNIQTSLDYFRSSGLSRWNTWKSFAKILLDPVRFTYLLENMLYELPWIGTRMFIKNVRKIIPTISARDVRYAKGYGGMRLQRVNTTTQELLLGEGKIIGDHALFNMTPSPGASVCIYNASRDAETIVGFLGDRYIFDLTRMQQELGSCDTTHAEDISLKATYVS